MKRIVFCLLFLFSFVCAHAQGEMLGNSILPQPAKADLHEECFTFDGEVRLKIDAPRKDKAIIKELIADSPLKIGRKGKKKLSLKVCDSVEGITKDEGYRIEITDMNISVFQVFNCGDN